MASQDNRRSFLQKSAAATSAAAIPYIFTAKSANAQEKSKNVLELIEHLKALFHNHFLELANEVILNLTSNHISYGGTSLVTLMAGFGILMSIHTHRKLLPT